MAYPFVVIPEPGGSRITPIGMMSTPSPQAPPSLAEASFGGRSPLKIAKARFALRPRAAIALITETFFDYLSFREGDCEGD